jgi:hypothetical protein
MELCGQNKKETEKNHYLVYPHNSTVHPVLLQLKLSPFHLSGTVLMSEFCTASTVHDKENYFLQLKKLPKQKYFSSRAIKLYLINLHPPTNDRNNCRVIAHTGRIQ